MEKDATAGGMRIVAEGKRKDKEKTKEDTLLASNQGPDEPVYPVRGMRRIFFFNLLFPPSVSFLFRPPLSSLSSSPTPLAPFDPSFHLSVESSQVSKARDAQKSVARMNQIQDPHVLLS